MIVLTGACGFIGSCTLSYFNQQGIKDIVLSDNFGTIKDSNISGKKYALEIHREELIRWIDKFHKDVHFVIHLGARTDTTEFDENILNKLNFEYTKELWSICAKYQIPLIYASSAATYGNGEYGYDDDESKLHLLKPLNPYGWSKHKFDLWALQQKEQPHYWVGLKFFNVFGPNEYHKGRMASVIFHAVNQIKTTGKVKLFCSHRPDFKDGEQLRDFIYVKDVVKVIYYLYKNKIKNGIYNLGTGKARTFLDLTRNVFKSMNIPENIEFIDIPEDIRDKYQYFTEAKMEKLRNQGYNEPFTELEDAVKDYVKNYLYKDPEQFFYY